MIYNRASNVTVWLGNEDKDSTRAFDFIERLLELENFDPLTKDPGTPAEWAALHNLMQRPWFNRRWIVQEIALARKATLLCGNESVSWNDFSAAVALFVARYRDLRRLFQSSEDFHNHPNYLGEVEALGAKSLVEITSNLFRKDDEGVVLERLLSLEALISTLTLFEAGSPHDTIYAVLWLAHDAEPDSKQPAAMSLEPVVRTPTGSPEIDRAVTPDEEKFTQMNHDYFVSSPRAMSPVGEPSQFASQTQSQVIGSPERMPPPRRKDTHLQLPTRPPRLNSIRSASEHTLREAESQFHEAPKTLIVDYDQGVFDVFRQFLEFAMSRSLFLDIICHPWAPEPARGEPELPSWISQLTNAPFDKKPGQNSYGRVCADPLVGNPGNGQRSYNASGKTKMYPGKNFIRGRTLVVTGFVLDAVKVRKSPAVEGIIPSGWLDLVDYSGGTVPDRFWRTLVADRGPGGQKYPPAYYPLACKWVLEQRSRRGNINTNELLTFGRCPSIAVEFLQRVQSVVWGRMLVTTSGRRGSKTLLALVPAEAEDGDLICILYGCSVPIVLRRSKKRKAEEGSSGTWSRDSSQTDKSVKTNSQTTAGAVAPPITFSRASSTAAPSDTEPDTPGPSLFIPPQIPDSAYASMGVRKALQVDTGQRQEPKLDLDFEGESQTQYTFIGECYVHGMMAGEGFKHQRECGNRLRVFHLV